MPARSLEILDSLVGLRLAVIGDAMVDRFLWGDVERISPEAPVPVVRLNRETVRLGGAANVAANIRALGAEVHLFAVAGTGETSRILAGLLAEQGIEERGLLRLEARRTTLKTRIIAHNQQVVRADVEAEEALTEAQRAEILVRLKESGPYDGLVISDYGKGVLDTSLVRGIIEYAVEIAKPVVVDPKNGDFSQYHGATVITPNQKEASSATAIAIDDPESLQKAGRLLLDRVGAGCVLITRGEHGMALFEREGQQHHLPTEAREVYDVTGAGDTVIAVFTSALAAGASYLEAANLANHAAGLSVRDVGTAAISSAQIRESVSG